MDNQTPFVANPIQVGGEPIKIEEPAKSFMQPQAQNNPNVAVVQNQPPVVYPSDSDLYAFLNPTSTEKQADIIISDRFKNADGTVARWTIKSITQEFNANLIHKHTRSKTKNGQTIEKLDKDRYQEELIFNCVKKPDLGNAELCRRWGTVNPMEVAAKMLSAGEYAVLTREIMELNGFKTSEELEEDAKN